MDFEIRADGSLHIEGYVNAVERDSRAVVCPECGKCVEQIKAGAFAAALRAADNVDLLLNHDRNRKAGSTAEGNLALTEDSIGLRAAADITDREIVSKAREGKLRGWSFGFNAVDTSIEHRAEGLPRRHVRALRISEVSLIDDRFTPCYAGTSIEMRADNGEELTETRFNPYHDPNDGRFTDSGGGGTGTTLYVGKGEKGKGQYVVDSKSFERKNVENTNLGTNEQLETIEELKNKADKKDYKLTLFPEDEDGMIPFELEKPAQIVHKEKGGKMSSPEKADIYSGVEYRQGKIFRSGGYTFTGNRYAETLIKKGSLPQTKRAVPVLVDLAKGSDYIAICQDVINADYIERYNKAVMDGYRIRAELASVPP